jgi:YHS domain-containing protein
MAKDPVCGMDVDEPTSKYTVQHEGETYYFCAPGCKKAFQTEPAKYLDPTYTAHM